MSDDNNTQSSAPAADTSAAPDQIVDQSQDGSSPETQLAGATPAQVKKMLRKLDLKIDGESYSEELPFDVPEEHAEYMRNQLQMSKAAQKRMQESASLQNEVKNFVKTLKGNTKQALEQLGIDPEAFAASILDEHLKKQAMTPEQLEKEELMAKVKTMEEERKKEREDFDKKEFERITDLEYNRISTKIEKAIDTSGLPKEPYVVKKIANYMLVGNQMGVKLDPEDVVEVVREEIFADLQQLIKSLGVDKVEQFIGKDILNEIRKKNVSKARTTPATAKGQIKDVGSAKKEVNPIEKKNIKQLFGI